jgi:hypothetical protein
LGAESFLLRRPYYDPHFFQVAIGYDAKENISTGFAVVHSGCDIPKMIRSGIRTLGLTSLHPLLLPIILLENRVDTKTSWLQYRHQELDQMGRTCGQYEYGGHPLPDPLDIDFVSLTRRLTRRGHGMPSGPLGIKCVISALEQATLWNQTFQSNRSKISIPIETPSMSRDSAILESRMEYLKDTCNVLLWEIECERARIHDLTRAVCRVLARYFSKTCSHEAAKCHQVYHYMAAKNAKSNLRIAETSAIIARASKEDSAVMRTIATESRRDSSAMKTISLLGMVFLPGTFIAVSSLAWSGLLESADNPGRLSSQCLCSIGM